MNKGVFITAIFFVALALILILIAVPIPLPVKFADKNAFSDPLEIEYTGKGTLYSCTAEGDIPPSGDRVLIVPAPTESDTGIERTVFIYTPPGFSPHRVYPILYCLHGFAARPAFWLEKLLPRIETAIIKGDLQPLVVVMPDGTIGGNGLDDPETDIDERGGAWYINSNLSMYENFLLSDLPDFIGKYVRISKDAGNTIISGSSMGGFAAAFYSLRYPERFRNAALFYPALDLRYAVRGNRLSPFNGERYSPIESDKPGRIVNKAVGAGIFGLTEEWSYYPVFDSDTNPGWIWIEDIPVWERMKTANPKDILETEKPSLEGTRYFILTGSKDDFNFDDHQRIVLPLLIEAGAVVEPDETIIPEGRHNWSSIESRLPDFIRWLNRTLK